MVQKKFAALLGGKAKRQFLQRNINAKRLVNGLVKSFNMNGGEKHNHHGWDYNEGQRIATCLKPHNYGNNTAPIWKLELYANYNWTNESKDTVYGAYKHLKAMADAFIND